MLTDDVKAKFATHALEPAVGSPDDFKALMRTEMQEWARLIKDAKIAAE